MNHTALTVRRPIPAEREPSWSIPKEVMADKSLTPGEKLIFGVILSLSRGRWGVCAARNEVLAESTGLCVKQVLRGLRRLEGAGLIARVIDDHRRIKIEVTREQKVPGGRDNLSVPPRDNLSPLICELDSRGKIGGVSPTVQNFNPPSDPEPARPPDPEQLSRTIARARGRDKLAEFARGALRGWVRTGLISAETVPDDLLAPALPRADGPRNISRHPPSPTIGSAGPA